MSADEHPDPREHGLRLLAEVDHLRHVRQVVQREADHLGTPVRQEIAKRLRPRRLQIEQADVMSRRLCRRRHHLEPERLQPQVDLRVHEGGWMYKQDSHTGEFDSSMLPPCMFDAN